MNNKNVNIINLGCRLNIYEGEVIKSLTNKACLSNYTIINSCAVTEKAEKKVRYEIRKSKKNFPNKKIIVTGCAAQINPNNYAIIKDVDFVIGNNEKINQNTWLSLSKDNPVQVKNIFNSDINEKNVIEKFEGKSRAYIEIQQGCDHRCTFCIIPFGRGNNRSIPVGVIVEKIKLLVKNGYQEVVLTGVDITDYGKDKSGMPNLFQLSQHLLNFVPELEQLRLSSMDCAEITEDFWNLLKNKRFMPHIHLSLQSGNDLILKRMKRRHSKQQIISFCKKVRSLRNDVVFGADIIAGFPTETDAMFEETLGLIEDCDLTYLHVFPYSVRPGTSAAFMGSKVEPWGKKERMERMLSLARTKASEHRNRVLGTVQQVLWEKEDVSQPGMYLGLTDNYLKVRTRSSTSLINRVVAARLVRYEGGAVDCELV
mgnify:CR=1 FL=1